MITSLRPVLPLFNFTAPRCSSNIRLRPRHVFHVRWFLSHSRKRDIEVKSLNFPRRPVPYWSKIWWITRHVPILPIRLIFLIPLCLYRYGRGWNLPVMNKGVEINRRAGFLLYLGSGCVELVAGVMLPWGLLTIGQGPSMQPTIPAPPAPMYASFAYINKQDVRRGDVVTVTKTEPNNRKRLICKRVAALEGDRIWVNRCDPLRIQRKIVRVRFVISLLSSVFTYGRYRYRSDTASWLGIILQGLVTRGHSVRCRLNPFWLKTNGDGA